MATLTSTKIKNTYDALLKSIDNDAIGTTAKQITDGLGNLTPLYISTTQIGIGVTPESGLNLHVFGDAKIGSNLTVIGNLVVEGSTTTVGTDTLTVKDPLIVLANNNTSTDAVDIGFYGKYTPSGTTLYSGLFREALTGKYRLFKGLEDEPTTTVNTSGTGYTRADLIIGALEATTGTFSDNVLIATDKKLYFNSPSNLSLYHNNSTNGSVIENSQGDLTIQGIGSSDDVNIKSADDVKIFVNGTDQAIDANASGGVELFYSNSKKLETTSTGISVTGIISNLTDPSAAQDAATKNYVDTQISANNELSEVLANGNTTGGTDIVVSVGDDIVFGSTSKAIYSNALEIYRDGNDAYLKALNGSLSLINNDNGTEKTVIKVNSNTAELYNNDSKKLETTSTGISVTGTGDFSGDVDIDGTLEVDDLDILQSASLADNKNFYFGFNSHATFGDVNAGNLKIWSNSSQYNFIKSGSGTSLHFIGNKVSDGTIYDMMRLDEEAGVRLYYNDVEKLATTSTGISVSGTGSTFAGNVDINGGVVTLGVADTSSGHINAYENMTFNIDIDNDDTTRYFGFYKNGSDGSGTELLRIEESGNVGIGTNNPDARFSAVSSSANSTIAKIGGLEYSGNQRGLTIKTFQSAGGDDCGVEFNAAEGLSGYGSFIFKADTAERMRIDSSGNVLINSGVYLSWGTNGASSIEGSTVSNKLQFRTNSTDAMIIDSSQRVGIGTTSPDYDLDVERIATTVNDDPTIRVRNAWNGEGNNTGFTNRALGLYSAGAGTVITKIQSRFDSGANIGQIGTETNHDFLFTTNDTERMRITSAGQVLIGKTSTSIDTGDGFRFDTNGEGFTTIATPSTGLGCWFVRAASTSAYKFYVRGDGQIFASSTSISAISDITLKENIKPLETGLNEIMKLKPRRFDWKDKSSINVAGFIAQEVEEVLPELIDDFKLDDDLTKKSLKMGDMIPTLVKAIQELKAEVEELRTQINN